MAKKEDWNRKLYKMAVLTVVVMLLIAVYQEINKKPSFNYNAPTQAININQNPTVNYGNSNYYHPSQTNQKQTRLDKINKYVSTAKEVKNLAKDIKELFSKDSKE